MRNKRPYIVLGVAAVIILSLFIYLQGDDEKDYSWREHYREAGEDPYSTSIIRNLLESYNTDELKELRSSISK